MEHLEHKGLVYCTYDIYILTKKIFYVGGGDGWLIHFLVDVLDSFVEDVSEDTIVDNIFFFVEFFKLCRITIEELQWATEVQ